MARWALGRADMAQTSLTNSVWIRSSEKLGGMDGKSYFCFIMKLRQDLVLRKVGDDFIMVDPSQGMVDLSKVHTLNETAAWLWEQLGAAEVSAERITDLLCERYDVSTDQAQRDAEALLQEFTTAGLLEA